MRSFQWSKILYEEVFLTFCTHVLTVLVIGKWLFMLFITTLPQYLKWDNMLKSLSWFKWKETVNWNQFTFQYFYLKSSGIFMILLYLVRWGGQIWSLHCVLWISSFQLYMWSVISMLFIFSFLIFNILLFHRTVILVSSIGHAVCW